MTVRSATPYIMVMGQAEQAIAFYTTALGAEQKTLMRFGDHNPNCPDAIKSNVMHCELALDGKVMLMLSDGPGHGERLEPSHLVSIALDFDDPEHAKKCFASLAEGGQIVEKLMAAPWGALFGALNDRFGVSWMFNAKL